MAVALCDEEFGPSILFEFLLKLNGFSDLTVFKLNKLVLDVAIGVCLGEDVQSFLILTLGD